MVNQIVTAIKLGYEVRILTEEFCDISENANKDLFRQYELENKLILEDYNIPETKRGRAFKGMSLIIKRWDLFKPLLIFYKSSNRKGFFPIFQFFFYASLRNYEVIHIQFGTNKDPIDILKKNGFLKSRIITSFHGHDLHFPINNQILEDGYYDNLFEVADVLVCNTTYLKEKLKTLRAPENKIETIPVTVDTDTFRPAAFHRDKNKLKLMTVGRMDQLKGQEYGIKAVNLLIKKGIDVQYILVGTGIYEERLKKMVDELGLNGNISFKGKTNPKDVAKLLQSADIFLMTSVTNKVGMQESQGLVTAEAQACGLPVIAFDTGGVKYTLKDGQTGFLCREKEVNAMADKIELLINNPKLREEIGKKAREFIEKEYSEIAVMNKWQDIYG
ncbi:glycosyltransferase family 4 protein [Salegentibacter salinarum]|uniref:glycosyltransferase family 4 protein n=1 Tax=Salegentibacter salinarum TaxID=447422 RepID=UPI0013565874|nr:glycosyltransferase family 4 protein [Salegentibacter salinarum]